MASWFISLLVVSGIVMPAMRYFTGWHRSTWLLALESGVTRGKRITSQRGISPTGAVMREAYS
ncbi:hypothetical protein ACKGF3_001438 [Salmonella enterica]|nr:hypothetical protein [Salmonella enterica subsp. enterica]EHI1990585.1 hypothetical protein [Salmonella enterica]EIT8884617.1 hypothetical protein [Salmonella enterica subsp. enterica serovar Tananarive]ELF8484229.1 hypothetical protein [Salmonella enterica]